MLPGQKSFAFAQRRVNRHALLTKWTLFFYIRFKVQCNQGMNRHVTNILWLHSTTITQSTDADNIATLPPYQFNNLPHRSASSQDIFDNNDILARNESIVAAIEEELFVQAIITLFSEDCQRLSTGAPRV